MGIKELKKKIARLEAELEIYQSYTDQIEFTDEDREELERVSTVD